MKGYANTVGFNLYSRGRSLSFNVKQITMSNSFAYIISTNMTALMSAYRNNNLSSLSNDNSCHRNFETFLVSERGQEKLRIVDPG